MSVELIGSALAASMPSRRAKIVLIALCDAADRDGTVCPSLPRLARAALCSPGRVEAILQLFCATFKGERRLLRRRQDGLFDRSAFALDLALVRELENSSWDDLLERVTPLDEVERPSAARREAGS